MCEKRPVTFRMVPKKSTKGKDVESEPTHDEGWLPSKCTKSDLQSLVSKGLLHSRSVVQWLLPWAMIVRMKIWAKSLLLLLILNGDWVFLA